MNTECTLYKTMDFLGKRWTILILLELYKGGDAQRFSELRRRLPDITQKVLSQRLKELEAHGLVSNKVDASTVPVKSEYMLTENGKSCIKVIKDIKKWAIECKMGSKGCELKDCRKCEF